MSELERMEEEYFEALVSYIAALEMEVARLRRMRALMAGEQYTTGSGEEGIPCATPDEGKEGGMRITFKRHPRETGLRAVADPHRDVDIKVDKKVCGVIGAPSWQNNTWRVRIMVVKKDIMEDGNENCDWRWISCGSFVTETAAREAVPRAIEAIVGNGYKIRTDE